MAIFALEAASVVWWKRLDLQSRRMELQVWGEPRWCRAGMSGPYRGSLFPSGSPRLLATTSRYWKKKINQTLQGGYQHPSGLCSADNQVVLALSEGNELLYPPGRTQPGSAARGAPWSVLDVSKRGEVTETMGGSMSRAPCMGGLPPALSAVVSVADFHVSASVTGTGHVRFPVAFVAVSWHRTRHTGRATED